MIQSKIYAACLQTRGKQGASRTAAPGQAGTNASNGGAFVKFDVPGATVTGPAAINPAGTVTGSFIDAGALTHSFLRASDGTITPFDPPGATCSVSTQTVCSFAAGITPDGTIVGSSYLGTEGFPGFHGYLRAPNGTFTVFDPPGSRFTSAEAINPAGTVTGSFGGSTGGAHGFLRAPNGTFTTFDPLGSTTTLPTAINPAGTVTGWFVDVRGGNHGFLRTGDGTITAFDPPGSLSTVATAINPAGTIVGSFATTPDFSAPHGFLRTSDGTITAFNPVGSIETNVAGINSEGTIVGWFLSLGVLGSHGFLRAPNGAITVFGPPGSQFTVARAINSAGAVTGSFIPPDFSGDHGFVWRSKNMH
jgi:uncharacterized membrane protein